LAFYSGKETRPICLMGPTASGKTDLAVRLADVLSGEVISVDSALVYRGLNIGAAKPTAEEMCGIPHSLIDIRDPHDAYSAADFAKDARSEVERILSADKVPILAGGTMLYFKALLEGLSKMPASHARVRAEIEREADQLGWPIMHQKLAEVDPEAADRIHPNHSQRIARALEVWRCSGKPMSDLQKGGSNGLLDDFDCVQFALMPSQRAVLHERIRFRLEHMFEADFISEVKALRQDIRLHKELPSMRAVGYRQVWEYLDGDYDEVTMKEKALAATRQLAKRQITWLRSWQGHIEIDTLDSEGNQRKSEEIVEELLGFYHKSTI